MIITIARQCGCMGDQIGKALAEKYYRELSFYSCTVSNFEQYTLAAFMNAGAFEKHINRLRNYYQHKRDLILSTFLREPLGKYITISEEDSGVHFLQKPFSKRDLAAKLHAVLTEPPSAT